MSKVGVGVGEDFPLGESERREEQQKEHAQNRSAWEARKHAFKKKMRAAAYRSFADDISWHRFGHTYVGRPRHFWPLGAMALIVAALALLVPVLIVMLLLSLISAAAAAPFVALALFAVAVALLALRHRRRIHYYGYGDGRYYNDGDIQPPPREGE